MCEVKKVDTGDGAAKNYVCLSETEPVLYFI
jgi:hypothetical protein